MRMDKILDTINQPPGTPIFTDDTDRETIITVLNYDRSSCTIRKNLNLDEVLEAVDKNNPTWIDIQNLTQTETLLNICEHFNLHPLISESIASTQQRPRIEDYDDYIFLTLRQCSFNSDTNTIKEQQLNIILSENLVISASSGETDLMAIIRNRLKTGRGRIRSMGTDYLAYSIIDSIVDNFFITLDSINDILEILEQKTISEPTQDIPTKVNQLKTELYSIRRALIPLREIATSLYRDDLPFIGDETKIFARDLYNHILLALESLDMYRERLTGIADIHLSNLSNKMNKVMQVLTLIATIFIPLTFLAGVYGMNFKHMPELDKTWAYPTFWGIIIIVGIGMFYFFKRKKWL